MPQSTPLSSSKENKGYDKYSFLTTFTVSGIFYMILAGTITMFTIVTGIITAAITATLLSNTVFLKTPNKSIPKEIAKMCFYFPKLAVEIVKSNLRITNIILSHPEKVKPRMVSYNAKLNGEMALTTLANSMTLTPGTLTTTIDENHFLIHTLDSASREGLETKSLEKEIRRVFDQDTIAGERGGPKRI